MSMIDRQCIETVKRNHTVHTKSRRELQAVSADILGGSKRSIFATQRGDLKRAKSEIADAAKLIKKGKGIIAKRERLMQEGMWRSALEEYGEASLYFAAMSGQKIGCIREIPDTDTETYIGAMSDLTGELTRSCVLMATERKTEEVTRLLGLIREVVAYLLLLDLTGSLRQKFDQAKQNLRKAEEIAFNLSIHVSN
ncbi:hypothetical protein GF380_01215 [Candidatus Uhrbacteria bacterium]|nr:hypothetical protein [Candidatus Uhrbacteria bacterium]MBD3284636.1 hypothetical protein [Candidatus Uhrbacteria bacterium]